MLSEEHVKEIEAFITYALGGSNQSDLDKRVLNQVQYIIADHQAMRRVMEQAKHLRNAVTFKTPPVEFSAGNLCYEARVPVGFINDLDTSLNALTPPAVEG